MSRQLTDREKLLAEIEVIGPYQPGLARQTSDNVFSRSESVSGLFRFMTHESPGDVTEFGDISKTQAGLCKKTRSETKRRSTLTKGFII